MKRLALIALLCIAAIVQAGDRMATVDGYCYLEGQTDHSGTKVLFEAQSPSAETDSVLTSESGSYLTGLVEGIYTVQFSKEEQAYPYGYVSSPAADCGPPRANSIK